jgi:hypothetical protein
MSQVVCETAFWQARAADLQANVQLSTSSVTSPSVACVCSPVAEADRRLMGPARDISGDSAAARGVTVRGSTCS